MEQRLNYQDFPAGLGDGLIKTDVALKNSGIDFKLLELIKLRASQLNKCAFCIDMHFKEAKHLGEDEVRLYSLSAWEECPFYTDSERAALKFTEVLTNASTGDVSDLLYAQLLSHFSKSEIAVLTVAISQINVWNRINKTIRSVPGNHVVGRH